ncbi:hypothetical protein PENSPDRAFT_692444 [Peniophora sp. CONT]|nr:hypothetical protein PENSPDRAFT_692444 [Peniophora sp. CONT]
MSEREEGMEVRSAVAGRVEADEGVVKEDEGMPSLVDASDDEEIQVAQELMAVDSDSDSQTPPQTQQSNTIPPPQEPAASAGEGGNLPGIRQVLQTAGQDTPVTFSMTFSINPLVPAPPPPASTTQPPTADNNNDNTPRRDPSTLLQALFGLLGGHGGPPPEDPARARTIVREMEAVSEGMVKRLVNAEEGTCAVCMECLEEEGSFGQDEPSSTPTEPSSSSSEAPSSLTEPPSEPAEPLPRIVALPCAHVFHTACLLPWLARQTTCPNCRFDLDPDSLTLSTPPQQPTNAPGHGVAQFLSQLFNGPVPPFVRQEGGREMFDAFFADLDARTPPAPPQPRPTLATLPTPALERALVNASPEMRAAIEEILEQRREASQVLRDLGMPPATTHAAPPPPPNMPATPPPPNIPPNLSPAAQALLRAHHNRLQTEVYTAQAAAYRQQAEQYRREAQQYREEAQQYREEAQMYREIGEGASGTQPMQRLMQMHQQRMAARASASAPQPTPAPPQPAQPSQPQGEGATPTQPGQGPLLSVFARQFADILHREIMQGMDTHGGQPGTPQPAQNAPAPVQTQPAPAQPTAPGPTTLNAQPHHRTTIQIFPFTPGQGQAPPPPPPGYSYVDFVIPAGGAQPFTMNPTAGAGEAGMDVDGGGAGMGIMQGLFGGLARALAQAHGQGQSTTPPGSPPGTTPTTSASAPTPAPTSTDPPAVLAPDGTLLLASDSSAAAQAQAQPRRTDSPARARIGTPRRVASGSMASIARVNPSGPSTPARTSTSAPGTPVRVDTSQPASASSHGAPQISVRDDQLPIAALPFPLIPVPIPVAIPVSRAQAGAQQQQHAMPLPLQQRLAAQAAQAQARMQQLQSMPQPQPQQHGVFSLQERLAAQAQQAQARMQQLQSAPQPQEHGVPSLQQRLAAQIQQTQAQMQQPAPQPPQNRSGFNFTPLTGPGGRGFGGVFTFGPGSGTNNAPPQPPVFGPVPPPGHPAAATAHQPAPINPFSFGPAPSTTTTTNIGGMPRALADMMDMAMMGLQEGDTVELRPVAPLPRRARSVPPGGNAPGQAQAQEGTQGEGAAAAPTEEARPSPPRRKWAPPPPPGPTLRQRVEAAERARGARCDKVGCVYAPSDERPEGGEGGELRGVEGCAHMFHGGCAGEGGCGVCQGEEERKVEVV